MGTKIRNVLQITAALFCLYMFFISIGMMGSAFKLLGKGFATALLEGTANPVVSLFIGVLATSLVQSSSFTTSLIVSLVGAGALSLSNAIPMIMGANLGTSVTSTIVSLGHITRKCEFRKALAAATIHDFFNIFTIIILFPIEMATGFLQKTSLWIASFAATSVSFQFTSPIKVITKPVIKDIQAYLSSIFSVETTAVIMVVMSTAMLFASLAYIVKILRSLMQESVRGLFDRLTKRSAITNMAAGATATIMVQSSSITTSMLVPISAAGIITIEQLFPIILGCNVGTTITALTASLATSGGPALAIALVHLLFNLTGILLVYPFKPVRDIPIQLSKKLADFSVDHNRSYAITFIAVVFFTIPSVIVALGQ